MVKKTRTKRKTSKKQDGGVVITGSVALAAVLTGLLTGASSYAGNKVMKEVIGDGLRLPGSGLRLPGSGLILPGQKGAGKKRKNRRKK